MFTPGENGLALSAPMVYGLFIAFFILIVLVIILFLRQNALNKRYRSFFRGKNGKNIEEAIRARIDEIDRLKENDVLLDQRLDLLEKHKAGAFQKCGIVKYDAFKEMGGKLSFAYAMLDEDNNGFLINSIHSREGCYTYIKEIIKGVSYIELSEEENEALNTAMQVTEGRE